MKAKRRKMFDGAEIEHEYLGRLKIRMIHRDNVIPPDLWDARKEDGKLAAPSAFSERGLHFILRFWGSYKVL